MIQAYADDALVYDSRLPDYALLELKVEQGLDKGGAAFITMPENHPAYNAFTSYKTLVTIYRGGELVFRGRALYPSDDFYKNRTITCEGERCFFRDAVMRPYLYQEAPADIFKAVIAQYNAQVDAFKQFVVGTVDVTDANDYVRLESENAEQLDATISKLLERCGGVIVFTTNASGQRVVNWYSAVGYANNQLIEFGENLLDFARTDENSDLATRILPYGGKDETTGERVTITSVNGGQDFIQDDTAVALRGVITKVEYWDDITVPSNLLKAAQKYLANSKRIITSLKLTAVDLSALNKNINSFHIGDIIRVRSKPHGIDEDFQLTDRTLNLLNPAQDRVTMGKSIATLTGAGAAGDRETERALQRVEKNAISSYQLNVGATVEEAKVTLTSLIQQTTDALKLEVAEQYTTNDDLERAVSTRMAQLSESFEFLFSRLETKVDENDAELRDQIIETQKYIRFQDGNIILGESGNELTLRIENDRISFLDAGAEVAYFSNKQLVVTDAHFLHSLRIGNFSFLPRGNGNLSLTKVG